MALGKLAYVCLASNPLMLFICFEHQASHFHLSSFWWNGHANFQNPLSLFSLLDKRSNCAMNPSCVPRRQAQYLSQKSLSFISFHVRNKIGNFFFSQLMNSKKLHIFPFYLLCSQKHKGVCIVQQCRSTKLAASRSWLQHDF